MENGKGGGHKVNLLRKHLKTLPDNDVVLFWGFENQIESCSSAIKFEKSQVSFAPEFPIENKSASFSTFPKYLTSPKDAIWLLSIVIWQIDKKGRSIKNININLFIV